jgi:transcriptional regulator with XRE-family HTH domain
MGTGSDVPPAAVDPAAPPGVRRGPGDVESAEAEPSEHGVTGPLLAQLGSEIRSRRRGADLTVQQLADLAGVSRRMLTQIEQGQANPSLVTMDKLARALGVDFGTLAGASPRGQRGIEVRERGTEVWRTANGSSAVLGMTSARVGGPELWHWTLAPGDDYSSLPDPTGSEELLLVTSGTLTFTSGGERHVLSRGMPARIANDRGYEYRNDSGAPVTFVRVFSLPPSPR